jgi:hypothetical protein
LNHPLTMLQEEPDDHGRRRRPNYSRPRFLRMASHPDTPQLKCSKNISTFFVATSSLSTPPCAEPKRTLDSTLENCPLLRSVSVFRNHRLVNFVDCASRLSDGV